MAIKQRGPGRRFQPGVSGNPKGRAPKPHCTTSLLSDLLAGCPETVAAAWPVPHTGAMGVALALFAKMRRGDLTAIKEGLDRVEGRVTEPIRVSGDATAPIVFIEVRRTSGGEPASLVDEPASLVGEPMPLQDPDGA